MATAAGIQRAAVADLRISLFGQELPVACISEMRALILRADGEQHCEAVQEYQLLTELHPDEESAHLLVPRILLHRPVDLLLSGALTDGRLSARVETVLSPGGAIALQPGSGAALRLGVAEMPHERGFSLSPSMDPDEEHELKLLRGLKGLPHFSDSLAQVPLLMTRGDLPAAQQYLARPLRHVLPQEDQLLILRWLAAFPPDLYDHELTSRATELRYPHGIKVSFRPRDAHGREQTATMLLCWEAPRWTILEVRPV